MVLPVEAVGDSAILRRNWECTCLHGDKCAIRCKSELAKSCGLRDRCRGLQLKAVLSISPEVKQHANSSRSACDVVMFFTMCFSKRAV